MQPWTRKVVAEQLQALCQIREAGRYVQFGVGSPGGSDLIGYRRVRVTPEMVGQEIAQFAAVEVKTPRGRVRPEQQQFIDHVLSAGGIAGIARSVDEAKDILLS
jgi:VRR-NUC domain.